MNEPLGLESKVVRLIAYDARWPLLFQEEAERLRAAVAAAGLPPLHFEHVGSTAVPGLAAKPVLDIAAARSQDVEAARYVSALEAAGYTYRGDGGLPGRDFFRRGALRSHHLHMVEQGSEHWRRYLVFRDALRRDARLLQEYCSLKQDLAQQYPRDREAYIEGKRAFIDEAIRRASLEEEGRW